MNIIVLPSVSCPIVKLIFSKNCTASKRAISKNTLFFIRIDSMIIFELKTPKKIEIGK